MAATFLVATITLLKFIILFDIVLSWIKPDANSFPRSWTSQITDPLYAPIRAVLKPERTGGLDLSPLLILLILHAMDSMLRRVTP